MYHVASGGDRLRAGGKEIMVAYDLEFDGSEGVLTATINNFWTVADAEHFRTDLITRANDARGHCGRLRLVIDASAGWVQSPEAMAILVTTEADVVKAEADKVAVVVGTTLLKLQAERTRSDERARIFRSMREARIWLNE